MFYGFLKKLYHVCYFKSALIACLFFIKIVNASNLKEFSQLQEPAHPPIIETTLYIVQMINANLLRQDNVPPDVYQKKTAVEKQMSRLISDEKTYLEAQTINRTQFHEWLNTSFFDALNESYGAIGRNHIIGATFFKTFLDRSLNTCLLGELVKSSWQIKKEVYYLDRAFDNFKCLFPSHLKSKQEIFQREFQHYLGQYLTEGMRYYKDYLLAFVTLQCAYNDYMYPSSFSQFRYYIQQKMDQVRLSLLRNGSPHTSQDNQDEERVSGVILPAKL